MTTLVVARFPKTERIASNTEGRIPSGTTPVRGTTKTKAYDDACPGAGRGIRIELLLQTPLATPRALGADRP